MKMGQEAFDQLLFQLDPNRDSAGRRYEALRRKLIHFFAWEGLVEAESLADESLNRLATKLQAGEFVRNVDPYLFAIARNVLLEERRRRKKRHQVLAQLVWERNSSQDDPPEEALIRQCLRSCLKKLPIEMRQLIVEYYRGSGRIKIENRRALARRVGVSENALRNRAMRLRTRLRHCAGRCRDRFAQKG